MTRKRKEKKKKIIHVVPMTPRQAGMYETTREKVEDYSTEREEMNYTEAWINADTGEVIIHEPYKVIDWTSPAKGTVKRKRNAKKHSTQD